MGRHSLEKGIWRNAFVSCLSLFDVKLRKKSSFPGVSLMVLARVEGSLASSPGNRDRDTRSALGREPAQIMRTI
jgi:hypothetical protein